MNYCKCGAWCDHKDEGGCSGDVIAVDENPCPKHRCMAHANKYGFTMSVTVQGNAKPDSKDAEAQRSKEAHHG